MFCCALKRPEVSESELPPPDVAFKTGTIVQTQVCHFQSSELNTSFSLFFQYIGKKVPRIEKALTNLTQSKERLYMEEETQCVRMT